VAEITSFTRLRISLQRFVQHDSNEPNRCNASTL